MNCLLSRHELRADREGARPRIWSRLVFRGWQGQLPLDLVDKDRSVAGQIAPEFFTRAGEPRQLPAQFVEPVHAIVVGVNCKNCSHAHLLVAPTLLWRRSAQPTIPPGPAETLQDKDPDSGPKTDEAIASAAV